MNELILLEDLGMIYPKENSKQKRRYGIYKCFCGSEFKAQIANVKNRNTKSCGCINGRKHNLTNHRLYQAWNGMIQRCNNHKSTSYKNYGKRGVTVCQEWHITENFIKDMYPSYKEGLELDRIDNSKGYCKDNCRWTTKEIQKRNTRLIRITNKSGYRGVYWANNISKYRSKICVNNKNIHLGCFNTSIEAVKAYDKYVIDNKLEHTLNF